jgi:hypothetical protein
MSRFALGVGLVLDFMASPSWGPSAGAKFSPMTANTSSIADELLLHDIRPELAEGKAMDLAHAASF